MFVLLERFDVLVNDFHQLLVSAHLNVDGVVRVPDLNKAVVHRGIIVGHAGPNVDMLVDVPIDNYFGLVWH